jgi:serine/threonine protein kinase
MGKPLTEAQRAFINTYISGKSKSEQSKITSAYLDYVRRRDMVARLVEKLEPGHPQLALLRQQLADAEVKARAGKFKEAYEDLRSVKNAARGVAKGYVAGLSPSQLGDEINRMGEKIGSLWFDCKTVRTEMEQLIQRVRHYPKLSAIDDMEQAFAARRALTDVEASWRGHIERLRRLSDAAGKTAETLQLQNALTVLARRAATMQQTGDAAQKKAAEAFTAPLLEINKKATVKGKFLCAAIVKSSFDEQIYAFEDALKLIKDLSKFQTRDPASDGKTKEIQQLEKKEEMRLIDAKMRYLDDVERDIALNSGPKASNDGQPAPDRTVLRTFHVDDVFDDEIDDAKIDDGKIVAACEAALEALKSLIESEEPNSDVVFDLMLKSEADLKADLAESMGFARDGADWTPARKKLIETMARELYQAVQANSPNRAADDMSTIKMNGKTYSKPEKIGAGGMGDIFRYSCNDGSTVVVKVLQNAGLPTAEKLAEMPKDEADDLRENAAEKRADMVEEMRMHRRISGGENGRCAANVLPMKGAAVGKDGMLLMLMDEAKGGDLSSLSESMNTLSQSGLIPEAARIAMVQRTMQQAVRGLKAVHDAGAMHLDVKGQNFLLDADGNVQIADFGSAQAIGDDGKVDTRRVPTTKAYAPGEMGDPMEPSNEVFWLGSMLEVMSSDLQAHGTLEKHDVRWPGDMAKARTKDADGTVHDQTSLDRLRNAMLDPDPAKRPSLDSVLLSSYLDDVDHAYSEKNVADMMKAVTAYNSKVGGEVAKIAKTMDALRAKIANAEPAGNADAKQRAEAAKQTKPWQDELKAEQKKLDAINVRADVAPLLAAIEQAGAAFK